MSTLRELQREVNEWQAATFPEAPALSYAIKCRKETQELLTAVARMRLDEICDECADVAIMVMGICARHHIDLETAIRAKLAKNKARKWAKQDDGTFQHVEETP